MANATVVTNVAPSPSKSIMQAHKAHPRLQGRSSYGALSSARSEVLEEGAQWGTNFWVTIIDPQTEAQFYACPASGEASWEPPEGHFVMPPSESGEWWELFDETHEIPYYFQTKSKMTQWTRPDGFVIPLGIIQTTTSLGRKFSQNAQKTMVERADSSSSSRPTYGRARSSNGHQRVSFSDSPSNGWRASNGPFPPASPDRQTSRSYGNRNLYTIPSEPSSQGSLPDGRSLSTAQQNTQNLLTQGTSNGQRLEGVPEFKSQSLQAAAEILSADRQSGSPSGQAQTDSASSSTQQELSSSRGKKNVFAKMLGNSTSSSPPSPIGPFGRPPPSPSPGKGGPKDNANSVSGGDLAEPLSKGGRGGVIKSSGKLTNGSMTDLIGGPTPNIAATQRLNQRNGNKPVVIPPNGAGVRRLSTGDHRTLPKELAQDIQQFMGSDFAQSYFATHRRGLIFRRRVPLEEMMKWQKAPITSPILVMKRALHKDAVRIFKVIQRIMGDRSNTRPVGVPLDGSTSSRRSTNFTSSVSSNSDSRTGGPLSNSKSILEEERWVLSLGVLHGELRDEIYCQTLKQLSNNPSSESLFRGWQFLCVILITFPPSKNLEGYVRSFIQERFTTHRESPGRIDVMAKYSLGRLTAVARKGPRGKAPTCAEIETASDAAFNPSTFGASLDFVFRLQQRTYPEAKVPIILPFLADGIIALGGLAAEGIWRISGDSDNISELKVRIDKGYYNLEGMDDCHVPASLMKLWLRELEEPLIPEALYNDCLVCAHDPEQVIAMIKKLPTINRRVMLFVISLLQLFLQDNIQSVTKMSSVAIALVISPALIRSASDNFQTVFTNTQHEHTFVHNLLLHLKPHRIDPDYIPIHGLGSAKAR